MKTKLMVAVMLVILVASEASADFISSPTQTDMENEISRLQEEFDQTGDSSIQYRIWFLQAAMDVMQEACWPVITLTSPNGGEHLMYGETHRITWTSEGVDEVALYVYNDTIFGSGSTNHLDVEETSYHVPASQGYFDWTPVKGWTPGGPADHYKIAIHDKDDGSGMLSMIVVDTSDGYFTITPVPEPATMTLVSILLAVLAGTTYLRRRYERRRPATRGKVLNPFEG